MYLLRKASDTSDQVCIKKLLILCSIHFFFLYFKALNFDSFSIYSQLLENLLDTKIEISTNLSALVCKKLCSEYLMSIVSIVSENDSETNKVCADKQFQCSFQNFTL